MKLLINIGNCKKSDGPTPVGDTDLNNLDVDLDVVDPLPGQPKTDIPTTDDGLPF